MKSIVKKQVGSDLMLYDGEEDSVHILNSAAQLIYEMHCKGIGELEIAEALRKAFEIPTSQALEEDIRKAIQAMATRGLL
jgi:nucleotidyltransferase/DNA polymerase involved in DNA repair